MDEHRDSDKMVRYCPECGLIGPVKPPALACCPDSFGMSIRRWQAEKLERMLARLRAAINPSGVAAAHAPHCRVEEIPLTDAQRKTLSVTRDVSIPGVTPSDEARELTVHYARLGTHVENFALSLGWKREDGEGAFEFVQRKSYRQGWEDGKQEGSGDIHRDGCGSE